MTRPGPYHNRIYAVMLHLARYWELGQQVLASDADLAPDTVSRLINGETGNHFWSIAQIASAFERELKRPLDPRELVSKDGRYPTPFVCQLVGCPGCLPKYAFDKRGRVVPAFQGIFPGSWTGDNHEPWAVRGEQQEETKEVND